MRTKHEAVTGFDPITKEGLIPQRDYSGLAVADVQLRIWIPEPAKLALEEICLIHDTSMTAYLTEYLTTYVYGYHELLRMRATRSGIYQPPKVATRYSMMEVKVPPQPNLGKNIFALKIWVPKKLKEDLNERAELAQATLGEFLRALICTHLLGREYGPRRLMALCDAVLDAESVTQWETVSDESDEF